MQAIITKYLQRTNTKPLRIKASTASGISIALTYHNLDGNEEQKHREAAKQLRDKMNWKGEFVTGGTKEGYAHVFVS